MGRVLEYILRQADQLLRAGAKALRVMKMKFIVHIWGGILVTVQGTDDPLSSLQ